MFCDFQFEKIKAQLITFLVITENQILALGNQGTKAEWGQCGVHITWIIITSLLHVSQILSFNFSFQILLFAVLIIFDSS